MSLAVDASDSAVGVVLKHTINYNTQHLAFFSRQLKPAKRRYSTFDRELLMIYLAVQYFQYQLEGRNFVIYTKPITFDLSSKSEKIHLVLFSSLRLHFVVYK